MPRQNERDLERPGENALANGSSRGDEGIANEERKRRLLELARRMDAMVWTLARNRRPSTGGTDNDK